VTVLVACPTAAVKNYCLQKYVDAYKAFTYKDKYLLFMDTTPMDGGENLALLCSLGAQCDHIEPHPDLRDTVDAAWKRIVTVSAFGNYEYILSLESDVIAPPETLSVMVSLADMYGAAQVRHSYPLRKKEGLVHALGCTLWPTWLFRHGFELNGLHFETRCTQIALASGEPLLDVHNMLKLQHLDEDGQPIDPDNRTVQQIRL
jgi:hypothetical protein